jgi:hypothetical protein
MSFQDLGLCTLTQRGGKFGPCYTDSLWQHCWWKKVVECNIVHWKLTTACGHLRTTCIRYRRRSIIVQNIPWYSFLNDSFISLLICVHKINFQTWVTVSKRYKWTTVDIYVLSLRNAVPRRPPQCSGGPSGQMGLAIKRSPIGLAPQIAWWGAKSTKLHH